MSERLINANELKRLQTLFSKYAAGQGLAALPADELRDVRLGFLRSVLDRKVESSKSLTQTEAKRAINELQKLLPPELVTRKPRDRQLDHARGNAGRYGYQTKTIHMATPVEHGVIRTLRNKLDPPMDDERYLALLRSKYSPTRGETEILTMAQANAVISVLKRMCDRQKQKPTTPQEVRV